MVADLQRDWVLAPDREVKMTSIPSGGSESEDESPLVVYGDEKKLRQVLSNLVGNAIRHTEPGLPVEVQVGWESTDVDITCCDRS